MRHSRTPKKSPSVFPVKCEKNLSIRFSISPPFPTPQRCRVAVASMSRFLCQVDLLQRLLVPQHVAQQSSDTHGDGAGTSLCFIYSDNYDMFVPEVVYMFMCIHRLVYVCVYINI